MSVCLSISQSGWLVVHECVVGNNNHNHNNNKLFDMCYLVSSLHFFATFKTLASCRFRFVCYGFPFSTNQRANKCMKRVLFLSCWFKLITYILYTMPRPRNLFQLTKDKSYLKTHKKLGTNSAITTDPYQLLSEQKKKFYCNLYKTKPDSTKSFLNNFNILQLSEEECKRILETF